MNLPAERQPRLTGELVDLLNNADCECPWETAIVHEWDDPVGAFRAVKQCWCALEHALERFKAFLRNDREEGCYWYLNDRFVCELRQSIDLDMPALGELRAKLMWTQIPETT